VLRQLPGLDRINDDNKAAELFLQAGRDPQDALRWLVDRLTIRSFDVREPSLHEVFIRTVEERDAASAATAGEAN